HIHLVTNVIEHQLSDRRVGQCSESLPKQTSQAQCAHHPVKRVLGSREPSLLHDQVLHADLLSAVVHEIPIPVLPIAIKKSLEIQKESLVTTRKSDDRAISPTFISEFLAICSTRLVEQSGGHNVTEKRVRSGQEPPNHWLGHVWLPRGHRARS